MADDYEPGKKLPEYLDVEEFFRGTENFSITEDVLREIERELSGPGPDSDALRRAQDWNELSNLLVGQEHLGPQRFP